MTVKTYDKIVMRNIEEITPYFNNPRQTEKAVAALIKVIPEVGFNVPIFIDKNGVIIKGHSRYSAAKSLGMTQIPCIVSENTDKQNNADRLYDNRVNELSEWNLERLSLELRDLDLNIPEIPFDLPGLQNYHEQISSDIAEKDFDRARTELSQEATREEDLLIPFPCPKCGEEILISKKDFLNVDKTIREGRLKGESSPIDKPEKEDGEDKHG